VPALCTQLRLDRGSLFRAVRLGELTEQALDFGLGVLKLFSNADGRSGDVQSRLAPGADLRDR